MSSSFRYLHGNPEFFPDPEEFRPERWIDVEMQQPTMKHRLVPFGKGTRQCLGQK
jgi:cytochrome P450